MGADKLVRDGGRCEMCCAAAGLRAVGGGRLGVCCWRRCPVGATGGTGVCGSSGHRVVAGAGDGSVVSDADSSAGGVCLDRLARMAQLGVRVEAAQQRDAVFGAGIGDGSGAARERVV